MFIIDKIKITAQRNSNGTCEIFASCGSIQILTDL